MFRNFEHWLLNATGCYETFKYTNFWLNKLQYNKVNKYWNSSLSNYFTTVYFILALEVNFVFWISMVELLYNGLLQHIFLWLCIQRHHIGSLNLSMVGYLHHGNKQKLLTRGYFFSPKEPVIIPLPRWPHTCSWQIGAVSPGASHSIIGSGCKCVC